MPVACTYPRYDISVARSFVGSGIAPVAPTCLQALAQMLVEVCKNPKNPGFNHYLFESVAALIKHATAADPGMIETFEQMLFPAFNHVLQQVCQSLESGLDCLL